MTELTDAEREEIKHTFNKYDKDHNGRIDWDEFCLFIDEMVGSMELDEKSLAFHLADTDHSGTISFEEFAIWWGRR